jgi:hypothetical protein
MQNQWMYFIHLRVHLKITFNYNDKCCFRLKWLKVAIGIVLTLVDIYN